MKVRFARQAVSDIAHIADFIRADNPAAADGVAQAMQSTIDLLGEFPMLGRHRPDLGVRVLGIPRYPYTVYYRIEVDEIWIVHVRDDRRQQPERSEL